MLIGCTTLIAALLLAYLQQLVQHTEGIAGNIIVPIVGTTLACDRQSVCPGDTVICTCITGNSSSLIWTINGNRLTLTSNNSLLTQQNVPGSNGFAMLTESSDINGIRVITSDITATASLNDPEIVLTCENVDRAMIQPKIIPTSPTGKRYVCYGEWQIWKLTTK